MAAQIRTKNRTFEPCKRVITPEVFEELLEARKFAVARSAAKAHLKRAEELRLQMTQPERPAIDTASSQDSEYRHHETQKAQPSADDWDGNGAHAMNTESKELQWKRKELKNSMRRQKAEAERLKKEAEKADKEAERKLQWAAAEQERLNRITEIQNHKRMAAETVEAAKLEMKALELQMEPLNEQKAKLVAQLKQRDKQVLQVEEASRVRASAVTPSEEGRMLPSPSKLTSGPGMAMDTSS